MKTKIKKLGLGKIVAIAAIGIFSLTAVVLNLQSVAKIESRNLCATNLKRIEAKPDIVLVCPSGGIYKSAVNSKPICSIHGGAIPRKTP